MARLATTRERMLANAGLLVMVAMAGGFFPILERLLVSWDALSVTAGWVLPGPVGERLLWVLPTMAAFAFTSNFTYALVGALLRGWLAQGTRLAWFNRGMAAVLVLTAVWMGQA